MSLYPWQANLWQVWQQQAARLSHAYLLKGQRGTGTRDFAIEMAKSLLCQQPGLSACNSCSACHQFEQGTHPDFFEVAVLDDKKEISIDQIRTLTDKIFTTSHQGGFKVALIEEIEKLNQSAFNALLKTLEEPPEKTVLILTAYQTGHLPATIVSRCRQLALPMPNLEQSLAWLDEATHADAALLKKALKNNWGGPLAAKNWIEGKRFEEEAAWQADMKQLQSGQIGIQQAVANWMKYDRPEVVFDYFYLKSVNAIRGALYQQKYDYNANWMTFQKALLNARGLWHKNINKELLLENTCLEWLNCLQQNYLPSTALKPLQVRGQQI